MKLEQNKSIVKKHDPNHQIIDHVKSLLNKRHELIEYLLAIEITIDNVKDILDLDVSGILQEG